MTKYWSSMLKNTQLFLLHLTPVSVIIKRKTTLVEKAKNSGIYSRWPGAHPTEKTEKMDPIVYPNPTMSTQPHLLNLLTLEVFVR